MTACRSLTKSFALRAENERLRADVRRHLSKTEYHIIIIGEFLCGVVVGFALCKLIG